MNRTKDAVTMLERCLMLNNGYTAAYLLLAKLHTGRQTGRLLKHVATYQPRNPEHQARYARWLHKNRKLTPPDGPVTILNTSSTMIVFVRKAGPV